jgi:hypothetical protein
MITDDEVLHLFARADPARLDDELDAAAIDETLGRMRTRRDHLAIVEPESTGGGHDRTNRWMARLAAAAVVLVVAGALVVVVGSRDDPITSVASQVPEATSPAAPEPTQPPPSRPDPLEEFAAWAERRGTPVVRPACTTVAGVTASAVTCYGLTRADGPGFSGVLVASAVVGDMGVDPFTEVQVGEPGGSAATSPGG